ncbi:flagellar protein FlgN [Marinisporobacter balticus]|uniref:FlgN protein n=1 Tax=Marinisporobacter balticus TaxID=2018667 RepID=A0A4R2KQD2_9FIRM|nr:flagellar protein FlgN [Marinisporobacter balticus]TCO76471.1 FlgN protein [Marinisporobacter balticus]
MSKSIEQLILALNKEYEIYQDYLVLAKKKRDMVVQGNMKALDKLTKKEQNMIANMGKIEKIRITIIGNILFEEKIDWVENITELTNYFDESSKTELINLKENLGILLQEIKHINEFNSKLIQQSLDYIDFNVNLLTSVELKGNTYGSKADDKDLKQRPNLFDAKI